MSDKQKETVDEVVAIIRETLVEVATALAARDSLQEDIQQRLFVRDRENQAALGPDSENQLPGSDEPETTQTDSVVETPGSEEEQRAQQIAEATVSETVEPKPEPAQQAAEKKTKKKPPEQKTIFDAVFNRKVTSPASKNQSAQPSDVGEPVKEQQAATATLAAEDNHFLDLIETAPDDVPAVLEPHHLEYIPEKLPSIGMHKTLWQVAVMFFGLLIFVNIPIVPPGIAIARVISDTQSLVVREGLIFKSENQVEVYVLDDQLKKRWIADIEAFEFYNISWNQVAITDDEFVAQFEEGVPVYVLAKCPAIPHVYALEAGKKRWIKDLPTFEANDFVWEQIKYMPCDTLARIPDGLPIPEDAGSPGDS